MPDLVDANCGLLKTFISLIYYFESYSLGTVVKKDMLCGTDDKAAGGSCSSVAISWAGKLSNKMTDFLIGTFRKVSLLVGMDCSDQCYLIIVYVCMCCACLFYVWG